MYDSRASAGNAKTVYLSDLPVAAGVNGAAAVSNMTIYGGFGNDTIADFVAGTDKIDLPGVAPVSAADADRTGAVGGNGQAGCQPGQDFVIELQTPVTHITDPGTFIRGPGQAAPAHRDGRAGGCGYAGDGASCRGGRTTVLDPDDEARIGGAVVQLIYRATLLGDQARWDELGALYTDDAILTRPSAPDQPIDGRAAIIASMRERRRARRVISSATRSCAWCRATRHR